MRFHCEFTCRLITFVIVCIESCGLLRPKAATSTIDSANTIFYLFYIMFGVFQTLVSVQFALMTCPFMMNSKSPFSIVHLPS